MGKSLKNVVTPDEMCDTYGADTFRVYEMSMGPLEQYRPWDTRAVIGSDRKSTRLNSSHVKISYAVFCLKKKNFINVNLFVGVFLEYYQCKVNTLRSDSSI